MSIKKISADKFKIDWGEGLNCSVYMPSDEMVDFVTTLETAKKKMTSETRDVRTEQIAVSKLSSNHRVWSYKNRKVQIEWGNLLKKISVEELVSALKKFSKIKDELLEQQRREREEFEKRLRIIKKYFVAGLVSLFFGVMCFALFITFLFFVPELLIPITIANVIVWLFFFVFFYLQQKNVKGFMEVAKDNMGDTVLPVLSNIPNNRKVVEMLVVFFVVFVFMSIYFSKTINKVLDFYGDPTHGNDVLID